MIPGRARNLGDLVRAYTAPSVMIICCGAGCGRTGLEAEATVAAGGSGSGGNVVSGNAAGGSNLGGAGQGGSRPGFGGSGGATVEPPLDSGGPDCSQPTADRCRVPGPPPATGRPDGSDYHFGTPRAYAGGGLAHFDYLSLGDVDGDDHPDL